MQNSSQLAAQSAPPVHKHLTIANHNNRLATECFIVIDLSPGKNCIPPRSVMESRLYSATIPDSGEEIFVKLIDLLIIKFKQLTDHITLWANALNYIDYKKEFFQVHKHATEETEIIVYYYQRVKDGPYAHSSQLTAQ
jgi:hypothetical protein